MQLAGDIGFSLFNRNARGISLTDAGISFRGTAQEIIDLYEKGIAFGLSLSEKKRQEVRFGVDLSDVSPFLADLCTIFCGRRKNG